MNNDTPSIKITSSYRTKSTNNISAQPANKSMHSYVSNFPRFYQDLRDGNLLNIQKTLNLRHQEFLQSEQNTIKAFNASFENKNLVSLKELLKFGFDYSLQNYAIIRNAVKDNHLHVIKYFIIELGIAPQIVLQNKKFFINNDVIQWCEKYIDLKQLSNDLKNDLNKNNTTIKKQTKI